jgi:hypothetical protein
VEIALRSATGASRAVPVTGVKIVTREDIAVGTIMPEIVPSAKLECIKTRLPKCRAWSASVEDTKIPLTQPSARNVKYTNFPMRQK